MVPAQEVRKCGFSNISLYSQSLYFRRLIRMRRCRLESASELTVMALLPMNTGHPPARTAIMTTLRMPARLMDSMGRNGSPVGTSSVQARGAGLLDMGADTTAVVTPTGVKATDAVVTDTQAVVITAMARATRSEEHTSELQ